MNMKKEWHQFEYPKSFIQFIGLLKVILGFTYRKIIGFIDSLSVLCPALKKIPNYTTLFRRMNRLKLNLTDSIPKSSEPLFISIDASGLKADHGGTWLEKRFGRKKRKRKSFYTDTFTYKNESALRKLFEIVYQNAGFGPKPPSRYGTVLVN